MRARSMVVVAAILASLFGPSSPASADTVQFTGTVTDFLTGAPVTAGGIVVARSPTTFDYAVGYINPDGTYAIPVADTSPHSLQAFANGDFVSQWARGHANFADADLITPPSVVDFAMHHLGVFQGTLTDQRGVPFVTAMVTVSTPLDGSAEVFTDANGHWSVNVSSAGLYTVGYTILDGVGQYAYGKASPETATQFRGGPDMNVTVDDRYLDKYRLPHIRGVLTDRRTGAPIMGASIEVYAANHLVFGDWAASGSTQPDGSYDIVVHPGAYKLDFGDEYGVYALTWYGNAGSPGKGKVLHVRQGVDATFKPPDGTVLKRIKPHDPAHSCVTYRDSRRDQADEGIQMPPIGTHVVDTAGVQLVTNWINAMP